MKKSELKAQIQEEIIDILEAEDKISKEDVQNAKEYSAEIEKISKLQKEIDDDEVEPTASQLKGDDVSKLGTKLQQITRELLQTLKKWKVAEGEEKAKLTERLRELTQIKKEIESLL